MNRVDSCSSISVSIITEQVAAAEKQPELMASPQQAIKETLNGLPWQTLLHEMVGIDNLEKVRQMLSRGVNVNVVDCNGETPLFWALSDEAVDLLVDAGADITHRNNLSGCSVFHKYASAGRVKPLKALAKQLRKTGKLPDYVNDTASLTQRTPLHAAAHNGFVEVVKALLGMGAKKNLSDYLGKTPLDLADSRAFDEVITVLT